MQSLEANERVEVDHSRRWRVSRNMEKIYDAEGSVNVIFLLYDPLTSEGGNELEMNGHGSRSSHWLSV
jgi:hypothetical protein